MKRLCAVLVLLVLAGCGGGGGGSGKGSRVSGPIGGNPGPTGNRAPVIASAPPLQALVGAVYSYTLTVTDPENDPVTLALAQGPAGATLDPATRTITWTPTTAQVGSNAFAVTASDPGQTTTQGFTVDVAQGSGGVTNPGISSGGTSPQKGRFTRSVTTVAQAGLPSITVSYKVLIPQKYNVSTPIAFVVSELTTLDLWATVAENEGFIVAEQQGYQMNGAWTFNYDVLVFDQILQDVQRTWNVDVTRVYLTGFSAGAHWSYAVGLLNADQFAGLGISAGGMAAAAIPQGIWPSNVPRKIAVAIRHGTNDTVVPVAAGRADRDRLMAAGHPVNFAEFAGGHVVQTRELEQIWGFLKDKRRP